MARMTAANFVNVFQAIGLFGLLLTAVSFVGLWIFTSRLDAEKDRKIAKVEKAARDARAGAQPVTHITASVHLRGGGNKNGYNERKDAGGHVAVLMFGQSSIVSKVRGAWVVMMVADKVDLWGNEQECDYYFDFRVSNITPTPKQTAEEFLHKVDLYSIEPSCFDANTDFTGGTVTLTVNSILAKEFPIERQKLSDFLTISNERR